MDCYYIRGGKTLIGEISISGSKNAALPLMAASLLTKEEVILHNVPNLQDIKTMMALLKELGKEIIFNNNIMNIRQGQKIGYKVSYESAQSMRASITVLGPLLAVHNKAIIPFPGGCSIGNRPVDLHLKAMESLGANVKIDNGYIMVEVNNKLQGSSMDLMGIYGITVLGTANAMMAACLADGETVIKNAALEPEIIDLAQMLVKMGAHIQGIGTNTLIVKGVKLLKAVEYHVIPDRIEVGTFIAMIGAVKGDVLIKNVQSKHLKEPITIARQMGINITIEGNNLYVKSHKRLNSKNIETNPYPDFPTDLQPQYMVLQGLSYGQSLMSENIFENRLQHVNELKKMNFQIEYVNKSVVKIDGIAQPKGARVISTDLRAGSALIIAGLVAEEESIIEHIYHVDRGYEDLEKKVKQIGGSIVRKMN